MIITKAKIFQIQEGPLHLPIYYDVASQKYQNKGVINKHMYI